MDSGVSHPCGLCGNHLFAPLRSKRLAHVARCSVCTLIQVRHFPGADELREIYGEAYFRNNTSELVGYEDYAADQACIERTAERRLALIERHAGRTGALLDIGCALGFFMNAAGRRGWAADGIDISAHAAAYARDTLGLSARCGTLDDATYDRASFDALTMWDVIEHVPDPVAQLQQCASLLRPGGLLVLTTPDVGSAVARATGPRWMGYKLAEEHLYYFSRRTMSLALEKAGFAVESVASAGKDISLGFFAERLELYAPPVARLLSRAFRAAHLEQRTLYVNPRDIMLVVARKTGGNER